MTVDHVFDVAADVGMFAASLGGLVVVDFLLGAMIGFFLGVGRIDDDAR